MHSTESAHTFTNLVQGKGEEAEEEEEKRSHLQPVGSGRTPSGAKTPI